MFLTNLRERGVKISQATLFWLDGSKALSSVENTVFGDIVVTRPCQVHHADTKQLLLDTVAWLRAINPSAPASLKDVLQEIITVIRPPFFSGELIRQRQFLVKVRQQGGTCSQKLCGEAVGNLSYESQYENASLV